MSLDASAPRGDDLHWGSAIRPFPGERVSGDAVVAVSGAVDVLVAIIDVLGHGSEAHLDACRAQSFLESTGERDVAAVMNGLQQHLRGSRGAAVGLCVLERGSGRLCYAGIGNTVLRRFGSRETRLVSRDGIVGHKARTPLVQELALEPDDVLLLYTDGIRDRFVLDDYRGILSEKPDEVARTVVERFGKQHDDAACIAVRFRP